MSANAVLLLACYELGHQPLSLAWPRAVLRHAGYDCLTADLAVETFPTEAARAARFVGIAVPMHTALRLGVQAAERVRQLNPDVHICFYGLYAGMNASYLLESVADSVLAGEVEAPLVEKVVAVLNGRDGRPVDGTSGEQVPAHLSRQQLPLPDRSSLPPLSEYAHYRENGRLQLAGYVEASRGCLHTCRHCPVVPIYNGRFFVVAADTVLGDIRQQVAAGAKHITFGDPDFLNGPGHAMSICRQLHREFPALTFDFTTKVEHIIQRRELIPTLRALGASFVVSAFESIDDYTLARLDKGHTRSNLDEALAILAEAELPVQPTWIPFTPWTTIDGYLALLAWLRERDLIANTPAVQLTIRLLIPPHSALLPEIAGESWLGQLAPADFIQEWRHPDPCVDELQRQVAAAAEHNCDAGVYDTFAAIERLAYAMAGQDEPRAAAAAHLKPAPPRLTEDWFC